MFKFSKLSLTRLEGVDPRLVAILKEAIKTSPHDFMIIQGFRSVEQQQQLYAKGRTEKGLIVTNCDGVYKKSNHQMHKNGYSYAIDFGVYNKDVPGLIEWGNLNKIRQVAEHIKTVGAKYNIKIIWGGDWSTFKDYAHIEIKDNK